MMDSNTFIVMPFHYVFGEAGVEEPYLNVGIALIRHLLNSVEAKLLWLHLSHLIDEDLNFINPPSPFMKSYYYALFGGICI